MRGGIVLACAVAVLAGALVVAAPPPVLAAAAVPTGVTVRQYSADAITDTSVDHDAHPELRVVSPMVPWRALEPEDDVFDLAQLDLDVADAAANGYRLMIRVMAGRRSPAWLFDRAQNLTVLGTDPNAEDYCDWITVVPPWDPTLAAEYREMLAAVGAWLAGDDGFGGTKADHVFLMPISMPTVLGSEMQIGFGVSATCPAGTDGAGMSLTATNSARWNTLGTTTQLRTWTEGAWRDAISIHMQELPASVVSVIAFGGLFGDAHAAALRIAGSEIGPNRDRLWGMYTNLQPQLTGGQVTGPWKDFCPACHDVVMATLAAGGHVGFQAGGSATMDPHTNFVTTVDDAMARYAPRFIETSIETLERELDYLLTGPASVNDRLAATAGQVLSATEVSCEPVTLGTPSTCTAAVSELWDDPGSAPSGEVSFASADGDVSPSACSIGTDGTCTVQVTAPGPGPIEVTASYGGDAEHFASDGKGTFETSPRASAVTLICDTPVIAGQGSSCTTSVTDADAGDPVTPTGSVSFDAAGSGSFDASSCVLTGAGGQAGCTVTYAPSVTGSSMVTATYGGSDAHIGGSSQAAVEAMPRNTSTAVTCSPSTVTSGSTTTCTASVTDTAGGGASGPTGSVSWSTEGAGSFGSSTCDLAGPGTGRTCSVSYVPSATGSASLTAVYQGDAAHLGSTGSATVSVTAADVTPPIVKITAPKNGANVPKGKTVTIAATASDGGGIARVEFRVNGTLVCTDTTSAYSCAWSVPRTVASHTIVVTAVDASGNTASATITVRSK